jgi:hypothetical protein
VLSGSGWKANENVYLYAVDSQTEQWTYGSTVAADASGGFVVNPYFIVQLAQQGANFSVTAVGAQSAMQADVKFTDAGPKPTSAITFPTASAVYKNATWTGAITGTATFATGTTGRVVEVSMQRSSTGLYWNGSSFSAASETFIAATNTTAWSFSFPSGNFPADGAYVAHSRATDNNGQETGGGGTAVTFTIDNAPPAAPSAPALANGDNSGSNADTITNVNTPHFTGTAEANSTVKIFSDSVQVGSGAAANNGNYSVQTSVLTDGTHSITATATDAAGNASGPSGSSSVTIDTARPSVTINQLGPDPTSTSPINFTVIFNESVTGFTAPGVHLSGTAGATTAVVTGSGTTYNVAVSGMTTSGTVIATIGQNVAQDTAANGNTASTSTDNIVTYNSQAATSLSVSSASGPYGGTVNLSATLTLTSGGSGVSGKTITFTLNGTPVPGSATTNGSGVATLNNASLAGINAGTYPTGVGASFAGDSGNLASSGTALLAVGKANATFTVTAYTCVVHGHGLHLPHHDLHRPSAHGGRLDDHGCKWRDGRHRWHG